MGEVIHFPVKVGRAVRPAEPVTDIQRRPLRDALDWQSTIIQECRRARDINPSLVAFLKGTGLLSRCSFFATDETGGPLRFRFIGRPAINTLGAAWARSVLGEPEDADPHSTFAEDIARQYAEAIDGGEPVVNEVEARGIGQPFAFRQVLIGWRCGPRRAVLSACQMRDEAPRGLRPDRTAAHAA